MGDGNEIFTTDFRWSLCAFQRGCGINHQKWVKFPVARFSCVARLTTAHQKCDTQFSVEAESHHV